MPSTQRPTPYFEVLCNIWTHERTTTAVLSIFLRLSTFNVVVILRKSAPKRFASCMTQQDLRQREKSCGRIFLRRINGPPQRAALDVHEYAETTRSYGTRKTTDSTVPNCNRVRIQQFHANMHQKRCELLNSRAFSPMHMHIWIV